MRRIYDRLALLCVGQLLCLFGTVTTYAQTATRLQTQEVAKRGNYFSHQMARVATNQPYRVRPGFVFTSVVLQIDPAYDYEGAYIVSEKDTFRLMTDEHQPPALEKQQSGLVIFSQSVREFLFYPGNIQGELVFNFLNAGKFTINNKNRRMQQASPEECAPPAAVSQEVWRAGLPPPSYVRSFHEVEHLIIHHSATANNATDYTAVVRNIYLWHTETNGWSDIGYNYLIAQDGTIFLGRDPGSGEQDNVKGAHFCGENTGTMGICLLGTYTNAAPTDTTLASLLKLMAWKSNKDELNPLAFQPHSANPNLGVIAGHRDGCATLCPGDRVYARIDEFREDTELLAATICEDTTDEDEELLVYPIPAEDEIHVRMGDTEALQQIMLFDATGKEVTIYPFWQDEALSFSTIHLPDGVYVLRMVFTDKIVVRKIIVTAS